MKQPTCRSVMWWILCNLKWARSYALISFQGGKLKPHSVRSMLGESQKRVSVSEISTRRIERRLRTLWRNWSGSVHGQWNSVRRIVRTVRSIARIAITWLPPPSQESAHSARAMCQSKSPNCEPLQASSLSLHAIASLESTWCHRSMHCDLLLSRQQTEPQNSLWRLLHAQRDLPQHVPFICFLCLTCYSTMHIPLDADQYSCWTWGSARRATPCRAACWSLTNRLHTCHHMEKYVSELTSAYV